MYSSYSSLQQSQLAAQGYYDTQSTYLLVYAPGRNTALRATLADQLHRKFRLADTLGSALTEGVDGVLLVSEDVECMSTALMCFAKVLQDGADYAVCNAVFGFGGATALYQSRAHLAQNRCALVSRPLLERCRAAAKDPENVTELLALAAWFCELTEAVCAEETACPEILSLLLNGLYALCYTEKEPQLVKAAFQFRLMALAGFEPLAEGCAVCGARDVRAPMLDIFGGFVTCGGCKSPDSRMRLPLTEGGLAALRHVLGADGKRLYSFTLEKSALQTLDHAGEAFIAAQLERSFRTLDYYKSLLG